MKRQSDRAFGLTFAVLFAVIFAVVWLAFDAMLAWAAVVSACFLVLALICPGVLLPLNCLWAAIAHRLGSVNNYVILGLFYYVVMAPVGGMLRLFGWDPMRKSAAGRRDSYWTAIGRGTDSETLRDMF